MAAPDSCDQKLSIVSKIWPIHEAQCENLHFVKRAETEKLRDIFSKYATITKEDEKFLSPEDFIRNYMGLFPDDDYNEESVRLLANCVDTTKDGLISFVEFQAFEALLASPDAMYALAFQLFDTNSSGFVTFDEFKQVLMHTKVHQRLPFNFDCDFIDLHFGKERQRQVSYPEFTQLLYDFYEEHALQAFSSIDKKRRGYVSTLHFYDIMTLLKGHLLTDFVQENLVTVAGGGRGTRQVSFPYFTAFISLLNNMELVKQIYNSASKGNYNTELTKGGRSS